MDTETDANPSKKDKLKGRTYLTEERCKGCSYCVVFCPSNTLAMGGRLNLKGYHLPEVVDPYRCTGCNRCGLYCPDFAIFGVSLKKLKKTEDES